VADPPLQASTQGKAPQVDTPGRYEEIVQRLGKVVERLEGGGLSLEESIAAFEEGIRLARAGAQKLEEAEKKVELLLEGDRTQPFPDKGGEGVTEGRR
jgi:exodeoxyribonuclease VII small subunit